MEAEQGIQSRRNAGFFYGFQNLFVTETFRNYDMSLFCHIHVIGLSHSLSRMQANKTH